MKLFQLKVPRAADVRGEHKWNNKMREIIYAWKTEKQNWSVFFIIICVVNEQRIDWAL